MVWGSPHFTIIVPTHDRPESLAQCLRSLARLNYVHDQYEVIVVDDGSRASVEPLAAQLQNDMQIRVIRQNRQGAASARNSGAEQARGEYLAFTDDDCCPHPAWLQNFAECFNRFPNSAVTGKTLNLLECDTYASAAQLLVDYLYTYYNAAPEQARFLTSNNFAVPASAFKALEGFNPDFPTAGGEDREFCDRWLSGNLPVVYSPQAIVFHSHAMALTGFIKQQFNYGRGAFHFNRLRSARNGVPFSIEPFAFYIRMFRYPYLKQRGLKAHRSALLFAVSQGVNLAGFAFENLVRRLHSQD